jgi:hypothetical protein
MNNFLKLIKNFKDWGVLLIVGSVVLFLGSCSERIERTLFDEPPRKFFADPVPKQYKMVYGFSSFESGSLGFSKSSTLRLSEVSIGGAFHSKKATSSRYRLKTGFHVN